MTESRLAAEVAHQVDLTEELAPPTGPEFVFVAPPPKPDRDALILAIHRTHHPYAVFWKPAPGCGCAERADLILIAWPT